MRPRSHQVPFHLLPTLSPSSSQLRAFSTTSPHTKPTSKSTLKLTSTTPPQPQPQPLTHLTPTGTAHMVRITHKHPTYRLATAIQTLLFSHAATYTSLINATLRKGDAIAVARVAGIQGAKRTAELIPLAHPGVGIESVVVDITPFGQRNESEGEEGRREQQHNQIADGDGIGDEPATTSESAAEDAPSQLTRSPHGGVYISATVSCTAKTGVEMEALTAATVAGLAMYDMLKGVDKGMRLAEARVVRKEGGKSGGWVWDWERGEVVKFGKGGRDGEREGQK